MNRCVNIESICPCGLFVHPRVIFNPPGRNVIAYRWGDYTTFRHALLQALDGETELTQRIGDQVIQIWRPGAEGDLALQMMEWWAYLADVLTFYNERVATQAYLRTADLPESVNRLIQLLGYRPRPGIGATGLLAALVNSLKPFILPQGFQVQSKPGPGKQPQVFELAADTTVQQPDAVPAQLKPASSPLLASDQTRVWLKGTVGGIKPNDRLLLLKNGSLQENPIPNYAWLTVQNIQPQTDPYGNAVTQVTFTQAVNRLETNPQATDYQLLKSGQSAHPWGYPTSSTQVITHQGIDLASIARQISVGDPVLLDVSGLPSDAAVTTTLVTVKNYSEVVWYANGDGLSPPPQSSPPNPSLIAIPITHTHLDFNQSLSGAWNNNASLVTVRYAWTPVGQLVPILTAQDTVFRGGSGPLVTTTAATFPSGALPVLLEDATGDGAQAFASVSSSDNTMLTLNNVSSLPQQGLTSPMNVLFNLLSVSRGKTVANEVLGSGNAALAGQDFTLQKAPVTYLQKAASVSGDNYSSTVQVWVNGVQWSEVRSFYGQAPDAQVFITHEDEQGMTHVVFGDGTNGSRLPTGVNNVIATYRYGSGADVPAAGTLTVVLQPQPGLKSIRNPVAVGGGSDPDPPGKVRQLAPRSVLTFNRAVSLDDYEVIAAAAPGVKRAKAAFSFDAVAQRPGINIWVGDDAGAITAAQAAIAAAADPNRPVVIRQATQVQIALSLTVVRDSRRDEQTVKAAVHAALLDPDTGLFGVNIVGIGQAFYDSQIYATCLAVPGVKAVHSLQFSSAAAASIVSRPAVLALCRDHRHDPGEGGYFFLPDDEQHLNLSSGVAT
jgi:hypothetical protein